MDKNRSAILQYQKLSVFRIQCSIPGQALVDPLGIIIQQEVTTCQWNKTWTNANTSEASCACNCVLTRVSNVLRH